MRLPKTLLWLVPFLLFSTAGCRSMMMREAPPRPMPNAPAFETRRASAHLKVLGDVAPRDSSRAGDATLEAAAYIEAQMHVFELQPALGESFRVPFRVFGAGPAGNFFGALAAGELALRPGIDYEPDERSDVGSATITHRYHAPTDEAIGSLAPATKAHTAVILSSDAASTSRLRRLQALGVPLVVIEDQPEPARRLRTLAGLFVLRVSPDASRRVFGDPADTASPADGPLPQPMLLRVGARTAPPAVLTNLFGFLAGGYPKYSSELVLVCARLHYRTPTGAAKVPETGVAALLEVARSMSYFSRYGTMPDRTVLFGVLDGGVEGLRAYVERPLWALSSTRAVIFIGLSHEDVPEARALLEPYGIRLIVVDPGAATPGVAVQPSNAETALSLAAQTMDRLLEETVAPEPLYPTTGRHVPTLAQPE